MNHYTRWLELKEDNPGKYARDIAGLMNISEAELTFARVGHDAWRLRGEIREILGALEAVGETKCICRNNYAVHEQVGSFTNQHLNGHAGLVLNPRALDLRLFLNQWASAFHISEATARGERQSIQFFDHQGDALLKVYATDNTDVSAWGDVLTRFIIADNPSLALKKPDMPAHAENAQAALVDNEWRAMTDVHQFFSLLKRHNLSRQQAFRLVGDDLACRVENSALAQLLETYPVAQAWFSFTLRDAQHLSDGTPLRDVLALLADYPQILAVGINCIALENTVEALSYLHSLTPLPLVVYPNSGEHYDAVSKTWHHHGEACATLEGYLPQWLAAGAKLIGGCCRTTPKDIAALKAHC